MFRRKQPAPEQRPRQMQITDLKRMHPSVIAHPDGKSFDLPVHTATTRFLLLIRLPDEFPVVPPNITVSVVGISHRLLQDSTVINPQLTSGWDPQTPLGGLIQNIVNEFVNNPPSILAEMASNRPPQQPSQQEQPSNKDAMHPSAIALPPIPQEIEELKRLSPEQLAKIVTDEVALEDFVQKLPLWSAILSLRQGIEQEVTKVANENLEEEKRVEQLREEIGALQSEIREQLAVWETVHQRQQKILLQSSPVSVSRLLQEKADRIDISCENLHDQYVTGSIPEDDFIKQYRQQRSQYHRLMMQDLQKRSSARVKTWKNTLEAQREQALAARARRMELAEQREQMLEAQEERIRQAERQTIIERAQKIHFEQGEAVRKLTSAGLLSEVLIERRFCRKVKKLMEQDDRLKEEHFRAGVEAEREAADREEHQKLMQRKMKQKQNAAEILAQKALAEVKRRQAKLEEQREGERIRNRLAQIRSEDEEQERERIRQQYRTKEERLNAQRAHAEEIALSKARDIDELKQAICNANEHQRRVDILKAKQDERTRIRREQRERFNQRVIDSLSRVPPDSSQTESEKIQAIEQSIENGNNKKRQQAQQEMETMVAVQMEAKAKNRQEERHQRERDLREAQRALAEYEASQLEAGRANRERTRQLAQFHRVQMEEKKREREQDQQHMVKLGDHDEKEKLKRYAESLMATYREEGDSIALPVILVADRDMRVFRHFAMTLYGIDFSRYETDPALDVQPLESLRVPAVVLFLRQRNQYEDIMAQQQDQSDDLLQYIPVRTMIDREVLDSLLQRFGHCPSDPVSDSDIIRYLKRISLSRHEERIWDCRANNSLGQTAIEISVLESDGTMDEIECQDRPRISVESYLARSYQERREGEVPTENINCREMEQDTVGEHPQDDEEQMELF